MEGSCSLDRQGDRLLDEVVGMLKVEEGGLGHTPHLRPDTLYIWSSFSTFERRYGQIELIV